MLTPELEQMLAVRPEALADIVRRRLADVRPCALAESTRVSATPMKPGPFARLVGRQPAAPMLSPLASKFGGTPYLEQPGELKGAFLGQINFSEVTRALLEQDWPIPEGMPAAGILAIDDVGEGWSFRTRWYPGPAADKAVLPGAVAHRAKYEARLDFRGGWSACGLSWFDDVGDDNELWQALSDVEAAGVDEDVKDMSHHHKLFGHANEVLNEHYGFVPALGRDGNIRNYSLVWRITFDNPADFAWGTNWLYAIIHQDDLARGAFENTVVTAANA